MGLLTEYRRAAGSKLRAARSIFGRSCLRAGTQLALLATIGLRALQMKQIGPHMLRASAALRRRVRPRRVPPGDDGRE